MLHRQREYISICRSPNVRMACNPRDFENLRDDLRGIVKDGVVKKGRIIPPKISQVAILKNEKKAHIISLLVAGRLGLWSPGRWWCA